MLDRDTDERSDVCQYVFDRFVLDLSAGELRNDGQLVPLRPMAMALLMLFLRHPRRLFAREALTRCLWPDVFVTDGALSQQISQLRRALRPFTGLKTVPRRGYRLDADVETISSTETARTSVRDRAPEGPSVVASSSFVGRHGALHALEQLVQSTAIVTVAGVSGVGKTRTVRELVKARDAVWCALAPARTRADVVRIVGSALGLGRLGQGPDRERDLTRAVHRREGTILVLDGFEHVFECRDLVGAWAASGGPVLCTSRVALGIPGERVVRLSPLPKQDAEALLASRIRQRGFPLPKQLGWLVDRLDRLPLVLELAAGWAGTLGEHGYDALLADRLDGLGRGEPGTTLRSSLDRSWALLTDDERLALAALAVAPGPLSFGGMDAILRSVGTRSPHRVSSRLIEASLIEVGSWDEERRFLLLETVRMYAADQLDALDPDVRRRAERAHATQLSALCRPFVALRWDEPRPIQILARYAEHLTVASERARHWPDFPDTVALHVGAGHVWMAQGLWQPAAQVLDEALTRVTRADERVVVASLVAEVARLSGRVDYASGLLEDVLRSAVEEERREHASCIAQTLSQTYRYRGDHDRARALLQRWIATEGTGCGRARVLTCLAGLDEIAGAIEAAARGHEAAMEDPDADRRTRVYARGNLGQALLWLGALGRAQALLDQAVEELHALGDERGALRLRWAGAVALSMRGHREAAEQRLTALVDVVERVADPRWLASLLMDLGETRLRCNDLDGAASAFGRAAEVGDQCGDAHEQGRAVLGQAQVALAHGELTEALRNANDSIVRLRSLGPPVQLSLCCALLLRIEVRLRQRELTEALVDRREVTFLCTEMGTNTDLSAEIARVDALMKEARDAAGRSGMDSEVEP